MDKTLSRSQMAGLLALGAVGIALRCAFMQRSYWFDELATLVSIDHKDWMAVLRITATDNQPPLYNSLIYFWTRVFGYAEFPVRALSLLAGLATLATPWLARRSLSNHGKLLCFVLLCILPLPVRYAQEARNYCLLLLLSASCLFCYYETLVTRDRSAHRLLQVSLFLLALSHLFGLLLAVSFLAVMFWRQEKPWLRVALAAYAVGLSLLVIVPLWRGGSAGRTGGNFWITFSALSLAEQIAVVFTPAGILLLAYAGISWARSSPRQPFDRSLGLALLPFLLMFLGAVAISLNTPILTDRNLIGMDAAFCLLIVWLLQHRRVRTISATVMLLLCLLALQTIAWAYSPFLFIQQDFRGIAIASIATGSKVCYVAPDGTRLPHHLFAFYITRVYGRWDLQPEDMLRADVPQDLRTRDCGLWAAGSLAKRGESLLRTLPQFAHCTDVPIGRPGVRMATELLDCRSR